ncbi:outer membrane murein-binding lipoprotein Lpp [Pedobacter sp. UYEF25]
MKNFFRTAVVLSVLFLAACSQNSKTNNDNQTNEKLIDSACYGASFEEDNAHMVLKNYASGKVGGTLMVNYANNSKNVGTFDGKFEGDTLFLAYQFTSDSKAVHTNPLAFLKKDGNLVMGVGQIETTLGRSYFVKDKPINFEVGKFIFEPLPCK